MFDSPLVRLGEPLQWTSFSDELQHACLSRKRDNFVRSDTEVSLSCLLVRAENLIAEFEYLFHDRVLSKVVVTLALKLI